MQIDSPGPAYFRAKRASRLLKEYRDLALAYWEVKQDPEKVPAWATRVLEDSEQSRVLREKLSRAYPAVREALDALGVSDEGYRFEANGGKPVTLHFLGFVIDQRLFDGWMPRCNVQDALDRCAGAIDAIQRRSFWTQAVNPIWWLLEVLALVVCLPVAVFRRAGLPAAIEQKLWMHTITIVWGCIVFAILALLGVKVTAGEVFTSVLLHR